MPCQNSGAGTRLKEKRYPPQITMAPVNTARQNGRASFLAAVSTAANGGRSAAKYQRSAAAMDTGMNASAENFDNTARPVAAPNRTLDFGVGFSSHRSAVRKAAP